MTSAQEISPKSGLTAFILCFFFGIFGIHRFYVGKIGTGILMLLTCGGLSFWMLYDLFSIICKNFTDSQHRTVEIAKNTTAPRNVVIVIFCVYVLFFGSISTLIGLSVRDLKNVGKNELAALRQGNIEQAYSYTSSGFQKAVTVDTFKKFVASYPQLHDNTDSTFSEIEYKNNDGSINGTLNMKDGSTIPLEIGLVKENDQWKVNEININKVEASETAPESAKDASPASTQEPSENTGDTAN